MLAANGSLSKMHLQQECDLLSLCVTVDQNAKVGVSSIGVPTQQHYVVCIRIRIHTRTT